MTHLEDRITKALTQSPTSPSPDLFDRVVESIDADRRRRRAGIRAASAAVAVVAVASTAVLTLTPRRNGVLEMPWWILEVAVVLVLTDIVCYLIFAAYILFMVRFAPQECWNNDVSGLVTAQQLASSAARVGGILLVIGLLHGLNIVSCRCSGGCSRSTAGCRDRGLRAARRPTGERPEPGSELLRHHWDDGDGGRWRRNVSVLTELLRRHWGDGDLPAPGPASADVERPRQEHGCREVGVVQDPGCSCHRIDVGEVEPLPTDVPGIALGCRVGA